VPTYSTADRAFIGTPEVRAERMAQLKEAFERTARILQEPDHGPPAHS
jgi:alkanesulfonate monooxygenase SsuD/methylene tetrahydromethanopterin reductase-like flavin-dependent oxidoreductase (luciferase family)